MKPFTVIQKIRFQHCDPAGIVFYPRYFELINATIEDWFDEQLALPFHTMHGPDAHGVPTVAIEISFSAPSRLGDRVAFALTPLRIGRSSLDLSIEARCGDELRFALKSTLVHIALASGRPEPWPPAARARIEEQMKGLCLNEQ